MVKRWIIILLIGIVEIQGIPVLTTAQDQIISSNNDSNVAQQANTYYNQGNVYAASGEMKSAIQAYTQAIRLNPQHEYAYHNRGNAYLSLGYAEQALQDYNHVIEINPYDASVFINRGNAYAKLGQFGAALQDYSQAIHLNPQEMTVYYNRGDVYLETMEFDLALQDFTQVITDNPRDIGAYMKRAEAYWRSDNPQAAIQDYTQIIAIDATMANAYYERAKRYRELEQFESAIDDYTHVIRLQPDNAEAYLFRGFLYEELQNVDAALDDFTQVVALDSDSIGGMGYHSRGKIHLNAGNATLAIQDFTEAIVADPRDDSVLKDRSRAYRQIGEHDKADADLQLYQALQESWFGDTETFQSFMQKGLQAHDNGRYEESLFWYELAWVTERSAWAVYEMGYSYAKMGRDTKALTAFEVAVKLEPRYHQAYAQIGALLTAQQDYIGSNLRYFAAFVLDSENHAYIQNIAVNTSLIDTQTALDVYRLILQRFPNDALILYNFSQLFEDEPLVHTTIEEIDIQALLPDTIAYLAKIPKTPQTIQQAEMDYVMALTYLSHQKIDEAQAYLQTCVENGEEPYKNFCQTIIENDSQVKSFIANTPFLRAIRDIIPLPE